MKLASFSISLSLILGSVCAAQDEAPTFESVLSRSTLARIEAVRDYVDAHPEAADYEDAVGWLLSSARNENLEEHVLKTAESYLERDEADRIDALTRLARSVRCVAFARSGDGEAALAELDEINRTIPLRAANMSLGLAVDLASTFQITGEIDLARAVYEKQQKAFFLNREIGQFTETRLEKLALLGDAPPALGLEDLDGEEIDLDAYKGKVVLLDFWATNCGPCIEMIPHVRRLHAELKGRGFEIVGLSLDRDPALVEDFVERQEMPWRQSLALAGGAETVLTYRATSIPTLYLVDRSGKVVASDLRGEMLERMVRKLVAEEPPTEENAPARPAEPTEATEDATEE